MVRSSWYIRHGVRSRADDKAGTYLAAVFRIQELPDDVERDVCRVLDRVAVDPGGYRRECLRECQNTRNQGGVNVLKPPPIDRDVHPFAALLAPVEAPLDAPR